MGSKQEPDSIVEREAGQNGVSLPDTAHENFRIKACPPYLYLLRSRQAVAMIMKSPRNLLAKRCFFCCEFFTFLRCGQDDLCVYFPVEISLTCPPARIAVCVARLWLRPATVAASGRKTVHRGSVPRASKHPRAGKTFDNFFFLIFSLFMFAFFVSISFSLADSDFLSFTI